MFNVGHRYLKRLLTAIFLASLMAITACSSPEEKAQAHLENGQELLAKKEYLKAGLEFKNAVKFNDKLTEGWIGLSKVQEQAQNWRALDSSLARVLELEPENFESLVRMGKLRLIAGEVAKALEYINRANEIKSDDSDVLAARAAALLRLNDREGARRDGERALALNKENTDAYAVLATDRVADGDFKNGLLFINRGLAADEKNLALLLLKIRVYEQQKDDANLEATLRQLLSFYPDQIAFRRALITMLVSRNRLDEAETEVRALAANDPENVSTALELVRFIARLKGPDASRLELQRLSEEFPAKVDYKLALAELDFRQKRVDDAISSLAAIVEKGGSDEDAQRARILLARMHMSQKEIDVASKLIADVLAADEKNAAALALRARIHISSNDFNSAIADLRDALSQQSKSVSVMRILGKALEHQGSIELAEERYGQAAAQAKFAPRITLEYVDFLKRRGKIEKAEQVLTQAVGQNPGSQRLLTALGRIRLDNRDWAGAEEVAQGLKRLGDQSGVSEQILGTAQLGQQRYDKSIETFKSVFAQSQGASRPMMGVATSYIRAGKIDEAELFVSSVLEANADNARARVLLGSIKQLQKKPEEAVAAFNDAIARQPESAVGYRALANYHTSQRELDKAEKVLKTGRQKAPGDYSLGLMLANVLEFRQDYEGAIAVYEDMLASRPNSLIAANNLASLLADHRGDDTSLARATELTFRLKSTALPQFRDTLGWVAYRRGEYQEALGYLKEASEKLPNLNLVRYHLGMTYKALEQPKEARAEFDKAMELSKDEDPLRQKITTALASLPPDDAGN